MDRFICQPIYTLETHGGLLIYTVCTLCIICVYTALLTLEFHAGLAKYLHLVQAEQRHTRLALILKGKKAGVLRRG